MHLKIIYNPAAGRGRARRRAREAEAYLRSVGAQVELEASRSPADMVRLGAESSRGRYDRVVVCGGDGSVNLALRDFDLARGVLAVIPSGSGDDFARVLGIPRTVRAASEVALGASVREVDVALANGVRFLGVAGVGFDSLVTEYANEHVKFLRGPAVYLYAILRVLPRFASLAVDLTTSEGTRREQIMFAAIGNTRQYGGGIRITPSAEIDDGLLDLCLVRETTRRVLLKTLPKAYTGKHVETPYVHTARSPEFRFATEAPLPVYADGERIATTPVTFAIAPEKLRVVSGAALSGGPLRTTRSV